MTVTVIDRFDGKRLEVCDHVGSLRRDGHGFFVCDECECKWADGIGQVAFEAHTRLVQGDGR